MSQASSLQIWGTAALKEALRVLAPRFEAASGTTLDVHWVPTVELMRRLKAGEPTDLVISTAGNIDELIHAGVIIARSAVALVRSAVGVAIRAGAARPDISSAAALKAALLAAKSIAYSRGPSGVHMVGVIERMGIATALAEKIRIAQGEPVGAIVARGDADIGFQQVSELLPVAGIDLLGPLPAEVQENAIFTAGVHVRSAARAVAEAFTTYVTAAAAAPVLRQAGLEPVK
jgi:molybdate transport system substrate-binding protein